MLLCVIVSLFVTVCYCVLLYVIVSLFVTVCYCVLLYVIVSLFVTVCYVTVCYCITVCYCMLLYVIYHCLLLCVTVSLFVTMLLYITTLLCHYTEDNLRTLANCKMTQHLVLVLSRYKGQDIQMATLKLLALVLSQGEGYTGLCSNVT